MFAGKEASVDERLAVMKTAEKFIDKMNYPAHTQVSGSLSHMSMVSPVQTDHVVYLSNPPP